jgi:hypothetical protein
VAEAWFADAPPKVDPKQKGILFVNNTLTWLMMYITSAFGYYVRRRRYCWATSRILRKASAAACRH